MRLRPFVPLIAVLGLAPETGFATPVDLCTLAPQEVVKRVRATAILFARPSGDSIGFLAPNVQVTVKGCALGWCEVESTVATGFLLDSLLIAVPAPAPPPTPVPAPRPDTPRPTPRACCRVCTIGKACGNSCIARDRTCRQPAGCACNGGGLVGSDRRGRS